MDTEQQRKELNTISEENLPIASAPIFLPEHTHSFSHQIAGHIHGKGRNKYGILKHDNGDFLKPLLKDDPRAVRELVFYEHVFSSCNSDPVLSELCTFMPKFNGTWTGKVNDQAIKYLCLQDVASSFKHPCLLDTKMGRQTFSPIALEEKKMLEMGKFPFAHVIGFRILGMKIYIEPEKTYRSFDGSYGKQMTPETIVDGLHNFFNKENGCLVWILLAAFIHRMKNIEHWFTTQRMFAFYASSLLFLYEGDHDSWQSWFSNEKKSFVNNLQRVGTNRTKGENVFFCDIFTVRDPSDCCLVCGLSQAVCKKIISDCPLYDVRMVDFAHVFPSDQEDSNYLYGLRSLISSFQVLLQRLLCASK